MSKAIENLEAAQKHAMALRPRVGGFPYLAETLRRAGVTRNVWFLPSCQSLFLSNDGPVVNQGTPLAAGTIDVPPFNREALIAALRKDQAGESTFPEFLAASWRAGVVRYDVDFTARTVAYYGCHGEEYMEAYPAARDRLSTRSINQRDRVTHFWNKLHARMGLPFCTIRMNYRSNRHFARLTRWYTDCNCKWRRSWR